MLRPLILNVVLHADIDSLINMYLVSHEFSDVIDNKETLGLLRNKFNIKGEGSIRIFIEEYAR